MPDYSLSFGDPYTVFAAGKKPLYIIEQAGHADPGFTLKRYGYLFKTITPTPVEWPEDLLWPSGCDASVTQLAPTIPGEGRRGTGADVR